jgi:hypothetical protein
LQCSCVFDVFYAIAPGHLPEHREPPQNATDFASRDRLTTLRDPPKIKSMSIEAWVAVK